MTALNIIEIIVIQMSIVLVSLYIGYAYRKWKTRPKIYSPTFKKERIKQKQNILNNIINSVNIISPSNLNDRRNLEKNLIGEE